jgi:hypothetical protein
LDNRNVVHNDLTIQMTQALETDGFHEWHLKQWAIKLRTLQEYLSTLQTHSAVIKYTEPFIVKLIVAEKERQNRRRRRPLDDPEDFLSIVFFIPPVNREFAAYSQSALQLGGHRFRFKSKNVFSGLHQIMQIREENY